MRKHLRWGWLLLVMAAPAVYPALIWNSGAVAYDAALQHIYRGLVFSGAINAGVLYPRWVQFLQYGLGSPLFTFQGPLPYYGMDLLYRLGIPHPIGWRILIAAGLLAAAVGGYLLVYTLTHKNWPALLAAVAYLYAPYVLRNAFERGSNEAYSMFLYPWVLWGLVWLAQRPSARRFIVATVLWALCIGSHVLGPLMLAPVAAIVALAAASRYRTATPLVALLAGGLLTACIWAPMLPEQAYVHVERDFSSPDALPWNNPLPASRLFAAPAVYDTGSESNDTGDRVGILQTALLAAAVPGVIYAWARRRRALALEIGIAALVGLGLLWLFTGSSDAVWRGLAPILGRVQYRMRLMGLQALAAAAAGGLVLALARPRWQRALGLGLAALLIAAALPSLYINLRHQYADFNTTITWDQVRDTEIRMGGKSLTAYAEFTPRWSDMEFGDKLLADLTPRFDPQARPLAHPPAGLQAGTTRVTSSSWDVDLTAARPATATLYLLYYPRWQATIDGRPATLSPEPGTGYTQVAVPAGRHHLALRYGTTPAETAGFAVSGLTLLALLVLPFAGPRIFWQETERRTAQKVSSFRGLGVLRSTAASGRPVPPSPMRKEVRGLGLADTSQYTAGTSRAGVGGGFAAQDGGAPALLPPWWLLIGLAALLAFKIAYVDNETTWLRCVSTARHVCGAQQTVSVSFAGGTRLRGYSVSSSQARAGDTLHVTLYWQTDYTTKQGQYAFLRLRNSQKDQAISPVSGNDIWVDQTHQGPGGFFNTAYIPGRLYTDDYTIQVPAGIPPGVYWLEAGWLDVATGDQIDVAADTVRAPVRVLYHSILLPSVEVR